MAERLPAEPLERDATHAEDDGLPILAPAGASPALASNPARELDHTHHAYESNPAPWWIALMWIAFLCGGATYLVLNLMR